MSTPLKKSMDGISSILNGEDSDDELLSENGSPTQLEAGEDALPPNHASDVGAAAPLQDGPRANTPRYEPAPENDADSLNGNEAYENTSVVTSQLPHFFGVDGPQVERVPNCESTVLDEQPVAGLVAQPVSTSGLPSSVDPYRNDRAPAVQERRSLASEPSSEYAKQQRKDKRIMVHLLSATAPAVH
ncbi:unnamed protein product [Rhizoctonia solani]|uniref:Uncharacterized protein n=1 Tax=Rhizoctonia solani TaxID=456999 RepID=A0A8H3A0X4_9AGAM|nr:unnamed protein product [Rhizoctonia solani]